MSKIQKAQDSWPKTLPKNDLLLKCSHFRFFLKNVVTITFLFKCLGDFIIFPYYIKMEIFLSPKIAKKFMCESCHYSCGKESDFNKHLATRKHKNGNNLSIAETTPIAKEIKCTRCTKQYKTISGLWKHNKLCKTTPEKKPKLYEKEDIVDVLLKENLDFKNIILELVKSNGDLQKQMLEVCKNNTTSINNGNMNNSHNKTFNMQVFLNEQCKDAMNIMDFVNSMTLEFSDLEDVGKLGYVEGISGIIIKKLNELDIYKRPIHCSDAKREIMYVKDENVWEKENSTYDRLRKAIKHITKKHGDMMIPWSQKYPACMNNQHPQNDVYLQIMSQSMGGKESFVESENKIMKKIAKAVLINKTN
jgi:hypothetical protein